MQNRQSASAAGSRRSNQTRSQVTKADIFANEDKPYQDEQSGIGTAPYFAKRMISRASHQHSNSVHSGNHSRQGSRRFRTNDGNKGHLNDFIQDRVASGKYRGSSQQETARHEELLKAAAAAKDSNDFMALAQISGYQSNPMAATLDGRTLGLSKMRITKK